MVLRGDLQKAGLPIHMVTDKMVLQVLPNDAIGDSNTESDIKDNLGVPNKVNKRQSIIGLTEEQLVIKYCELKARFDSLKENAGRKISELSNPSVIIDNSVDDSVIKKLNEDLEIKENTINGLNKKINDLVFENEKLKKDNNNLNKQIGSLKADVENLESQVQASAEMNELTMNDIAELNEKLEKAKIKKKHYKTEKNKINTDVTSLSLRINELYEKVSKEEYANKVYELKIEDLARINSDLQKNIDFLNDMQKNSKLGENKLLEEINKLKDDLRTKIDPSERE